MWAVVTWWWRGLGGLDRGDHHPAVPDPVGPARLVLLDDDYDDHYHSYHNNGADDVACNRPSIGTVKKKFYKHASQV